MAASFTRSVKVLTKIRLIKHQWDPSTLLTLRHRSHPLSSRPFPKLAFPVRFFFCHAIGDFKASDLQTSLFPKGFPSAQKKA
jgi:hypothetical protein